MGLTFDSTLNFRTSPARGVQSLNVEITFDGDYPLGGYPIAAADVKVGTIHGIFFSPCYDGLTAYYDVANKTIHVMDVNGTEESEHAILSSTVVAAEILYSS